jgi:hypothetical protein
MTQKPKMIAYIHTPPRPFTDRYESIYQKSSWYIKPLLSFIKFLVLKIWLSGIKCMDITIANSQNIQNRIQKYIGYKTDTVVWPVSNTDKFVENDFRLRGN